MAREFQPRNDNIPAEELDAVALELVRIMARALARKHHVEHNEMRLQRGDEDASGDLREVFNRPSE